MNWWLWHAWCCLLGLVDVILLLTALTLLLSALLVLVVTSSALASTTASVATSTSVGSVSSLVVTIIALMLISALVATIVVTRSVVVEILLTHDVPDELFKTSSTFLFCLLFQVILGLPEIDLDSLGAITKAVRSVEQLDASLGRLYVSIENETKLVVGKSFTIDILGVILQLD